MPNHFHGIVFIEAPLAGEARHVAPPRHPGPGRASLDPSSARSRQQLRNASTSLAIPALSGSATITSMSFATRRSSTACGSTSSRTPCSGSLTTKTRGVTPTATTTAPGVGWNRLSRLCRGAACCVQTRDRSARAQDAAPHRRGLGLHGGASRTTAAPASPPHPGRSMLRPYRRIRRRRRGRMRRCYPAAASASTAVRCRRRRPRPPHDPPGRSMLRPYRDRSSQAQYGALLRRGPGLYEGASQTTTATPSPPPLGAGCGAPTGDRSSRAQDGFDATWGRRGRVRIGYWMGAA